MERAKLSAGISISLALSAAAGASWGGPPSLFQYQLVVRSNFASNPGGSFRIPGSWFFNSNNTPGLNDLNEVAHQVGVTSGDFPALWFGSAEAGGIVHQGPVGSFFSGASVNNAGDVVFEQQFSASNGIYRYRKSTGMTGILTTRPLGASGWGSVQINNAGQVGYRASFSGPNAYVSFAGELNPPFHANDASLDPMSPFSFLFTPSFNNNRQIGAFVRRGLAGQNGSSQPDEIRIFNSDGSSVLIAQDRNANPASNFASFDNGVSLNDNGWVAFQATLVSPANVRGVFLSNGVETRTIARTDGGIISNLEFFAPSTNNIGFVVFRAFDTANKRAIWLGNGDWLVRVVSEEQLIDTDLGQARIDQNDNSPVFGGGPRINNVSNVAFNAALTPANNNQIEWGTGCFVAIISPPPPPECLGDANGDRAVTFTDITEVLANLGNMGDPFGPGDANGDGTVNFSDITEVLANLGAVCTSV